MPIGEVLAETSGLTLSNPSHRFGLSSFVVRDAADLLVAASGIGGSGSGQQLVVRLGAAPVAQVVTAIVLIRSRRRHRGVSNLTSSARSGGRLGGGRLGTRGRRG